MKKDFILPNQREQSKRFGEIGRHEFENNLDLIRIGTNKKFYIRTYGCQANVRDSETLSGMLKNMGFISSENYEEADVIIFNTCAVRRAAEEHVLGEIGNLKHFKETHPGCIFVLCGCMSQEESIVNEIISKYPQVDLVFGTHNLYRFPELLVQAMNGKRTIEVSSEMGSVIENMPVDRSRKYKAFVNIMYGCDKFCTYCIVPYTRGKERSRLQEYILKEVEEFKTAGGKEVTLLGQNVNAYGKDLKMEDGFTSLLKSLAMTDIDRIRFYTSHPKDYSETTIDAMRDYPNIMKSLHLPVQSGSNEVLKRMNRGYTVERYMSLFDSMKKKIPDITFTTDLIVGFPGETDEQFKKTLDLVDYCKFDNVYSFIYSPREGTPAAKMEDNIPMEVKKERLQILNEHIGRNARENNEACVGKVVKVLCDGPSKKNAQVMAGYSEENKLVNFTAGNVKEGDIVEVKITSAKSFTLDGEAVEK